MRMYGSSGGTGRGIGSNINNNSNGYGYINNSENNNGNILMNGGRSVSVRRRLWYFIYI